MKKIPPLCGVLVWLVLSTCGWQEYVGSTALYIVFSITSAVMVVVAWIGIKSYFYIFISTFWMLGFWMKTCVHVAYGLDYGEPVGGFTGSAEAWDHVLTVSTLAMCAAVVFRLSQIYVLNNKQNHLLVQPETIEVPSWYVHYGLWVWLATLVIMALVTIANFKFGIFQIGLPPNVLPWKFNALIAAALNLVFPLWIATLIWWDVCLNRPFLPRFVGAVFEAFLGSVSILSRGAYVYHTLHYLVSQGLNRRTIRLSRLAYLGAFLLIVSGVMASSLLTTNLRSFMYAPVTQQGAETSVLPMGKKIITRVESVQQEIQANLAQYKVHEQKVVWHNDIYQVMMGRGLSDSGSRMLTLLIDRWIGLEGVLAVSSYEKKGTDLFVNGWLEKSTVSTKVVFNYIANSIYVDANNRSADAFLFSSLPGLVAMLYYSDSYLVVFVGVLLFFLLISAVEYWISSVLKNPFVASFFAIYMANMVAQFGSLNLFIMQSIEMIAIIGCLAVLKIYGGKKSCVHSK